MEMAIERFQTPQHGQSDPSRRNRSHMHAFYIVRALDAIGNVPILVNDLLVAGNVVSDQRQDHHDNVLRNANRIAVRDFNTVTLVEQAACRSTWSEPMPAVMSTFNFGAF
jgi:hypothetical protein